MLWQKTLITEPQGPVSSSTVLTAWGATWPQPSTPSAQKQPQGGKSPNLITLSAATPCPAGCQAFLVHFTIFLVLQMGWMCFLPSLCASLAHPISVVLEETPG